MIKVFGEKGNFLWRRHCDQLKARYSDCENFDINPNVTELPSEINIPNDSSYVLPKPPDISVPVDSEPVTDNINDACVVPNNVQSELCPPNVIERNSVQFPYYIAFRETDPSSK